MLTDLSSQVAATPQPGLIVSTQAATAGAQLLVREAAELRSHDCLLHG